MDFLHEMKFSREFFLQSCADIFFTLQTTGRPCLCYTYILNPSLQHCDYFKYLHPYPGVFNLCSTVLNLNSFTYFFYDYYSVPVSDVDEFSAVYYLNQ